MDKQLTDRANEWIELNCPEFSDAVSDYPDCPKRAAAYAAKLAEVREELSEIDWFADQEGGGFQLMKRRSPAFRTTVCDACAHKAERDLSVKVCLDFGRHIRMTGRPAEIRFCCQPCCAGYGAATAWP